jgi:hypothetical protein
MEKKSWMGTQSLRLRIENYKKGWRDMKVLPSAGYRGKSFGDGDAVAERKCGMENL